MLNYTVTKKPTIGIPRALLFHSYGEKWIKFFDELGIKKTVLSPETNREIIKRGVALSVDEACFSSKLYIGHIDWLVNQQCDLIFVLRQENTGIRQDFCPRIFAMYDVVRHTFPQAKLLHADVNYIFRKREVDAFTNIGKQLGFSTQQSISAFEVATKYFELHRKKLIENQLALLKQDGMKVLIVSHPYNTHDASIGQSIVNYFKSQGVITLLADLVEPDIAKTNTRESYGKRVYWQINANLLGGLEFYKPHVQGIVLVTTFPCGPDSVFNDMIINQTNDIPILSLMIDELDASAGLQTRLESFVDILQAKGGKR